MEQTYYGSSTGDGQDLKDTLGAAASEFRKNIQEASGKLVSAAEQFGTMCSDLSPAVAEAKAASEQAQEAQKAAEEAKAAAESVQAKMDRDYSNLKALMSDLQERIGALAVLARPFNAEDASAENSTEAPQESEDSNITASQPNENAPRPAGWQ